MLLSIPQPSQLVDVLTMCQSIESQLPYVDDIAVLKDGAAKLRAIDEYVALTNSEGRQAISSTVRRIEMRVGEVLGEATRYHGNQYDERDSISNESLNKDERHLFRQMAANPEIVEQEIAKGTDERPTTRRQILSAIREAHKRQDEAMTEELAQRGIVPITDPSEIAANNKWIAMDAAVAHVIKQVIELTRRYSNDELETLTRGRLWESTRADASIASAFLKYLSTIGAKT